MNSQNHHATIRLTLTFDVNGDTKEAIEQAIIRLQHNPLAPNGSGNHIEYGSYNYERRIGVAMSIVEHSTDETTARIRSIKS